MILHKAIRSRHILTLLKLQSRSNCLNNPHSTPLIDWRPFSLAALFARTPEENSNKYGKPLSVFFKECIGNSEKTGKSAVEADELKEKLRNLEEEVRSLNKEKLVSEKCEFPLPKNLQRTDFGSEDPMIHKELSSDMQMFTHHLYIKGYLREANFMPESEFDLSCFSVGYARDFLKFAAVEFGKDHREIAKWLSGSDLKKVALYGCPNLGMHTVKAAKHMRRFFEIDEQKVCEKCRLKKWCKYANKKCMEGSAKLDLGHVSRVLTNFGMGSVPKLLVVPEDINNSVSRLLDQIVKLTVG